MTTRIPNHVPTISERAVPDAPTNTPRVRAAAPEDLAAVERLLTDSGLPLDGVHESFDTFVVAEAGSELVGVAGLEVRHDDALLRSVAVRPEWRSHGVGRALVTRAIADAEARGLRALYLLTTTAERYFPSFGFRHVTREDVPTDIRDTAEFKSACPASAVVMCRDCGAAATATAVVG